ncbi:MAG TPA: hypothetical protein VFM58_14260 [Solirubrobacteraceae bacterium]|nr:hypothetical protein [Solirubrobacteraceae bacterium]
MEAARRRAGLILALAVIAGCGGSDDKQASACAVDKGVLPEWARTGFSDAEPKMPHVVGRGGDITAILFGYPLAAPPRPDDEAANKVLWVARETPQTFTRLTITARQGDRTAKRTVDLGPSYVNLPATGCWHLTLAWAGHEDSLDLEYVKP